MKLIGFLILLVNWWSLSEEFSFEALSWVVLAITLIAHKEIASGYVYFKERQCK